MFKLDEFTLSIGSKKILDHVQFYVNSGEIVGLIGPSGAGKTILTQGALKLIPANITGKISYPKTWKLGRDIAFVFQDPLSAFNPIMTLGDQIAETAMAHRHLSHQKSWDLGAQVVKSLGLCPSLMRRLPDQLSGGQIQRMAIAQALICEPQLTIFDEPFTALDAESRELVIEKMRELRQHGHSAIVISHYLPLIQKLCDRCYQIDGGTVRGLY